MILPEHQVVVEVLADGRWAQEPWKPQLEVLKGEKKTISISLAMRLEAAGLCKILDRNPQIPKHVKQKAEQSPAKKDKKAAKG